MSKEMSNEQKTKEFMISLGERINTTMPEGVGFALFVYPHNKIGQANYISTSNRTDVIKVLRGWIERKEVELDEN
jgi:hypothetical protein